MSKTAVTMDIRETIRSLTRLPSSTSNPLFVPLRKTSQKSQDEIRKKQKPVRNENLYDIDNEDDYLSDYSDIVSQRVLNENEIVSSIKIANGGITYANDKIEDYWSNKQREASSSSKGQDDSTPDDISILSDTKCNDVEHNNNEIEEALKKSKLYKNAAIIGLLNSKKISIKDLEFPADSNFANIQTKSGESERTENDRLVDSEQSKYRMKLVPLPDEPDVYVQPVQAYGIDVNDYKEIDFTVAHVGKKKTVTPLQYFIEEDDTSSFEFVKKNSKRK